MNYLDKVDRKVKEYFQVLEPNFPMWLNDYINTKEMLHQQYISVSCGTIYTKLLKYDFFYSSLDHSIGVALIIWHFTHDKKETLAGLFHDIATPVFKHCVDFLEGDYETQEATEDLTSVIIKNSKEIMKLLKRDNIKLEEVDNYHLYPIADNDTPKLSSDRLEYSLSNAYLAYNAYTNTKLDDIKEIYNDIYIATNENHIQELAFKTLKTARKFVKITSILSIIYRSHEVRYSMQFIADILKKLSNDKLLKKEDLYTLKESEVIKIIENSKYKEIFNKWREALKINISSTKPNRVYAVKLKVKVRYIVPLVGNKRINEISKIAKKTIEENLKYDMTPYVYLDLDF